MVQLKSDEHLKMFLGTLHHWAGIYQRKGLGEYDDCLQEACMVYMRACDEYDKNRSKFNTFLNVKLKTNMYDMLRKNKKDIEYVSLDSDEEFLETILDYSEGFSNPEDLNDVGVIIGLRYRGYGMQTIADLLGVSRQTVYRWLEKEKDNLKDNS